RSPLSPMKASPSTSLIKQNPGIRVALKGFVARAVHALQARKILPLSSLQRLEKSRRGQLRGPGLLRGIESLGIRARANRIKVSAIPSEGPLIVTGNHPIFGDGLALLSLMLGARKYSDVKIVAISHVVDHPELKPYVIEINEQCNRQIVSDMVKHIKGGGVLIIFPEDMLHGRRFGRRRAAPAWKRGVGTIAKRSGAPILPFYIANMPSRLLPWSILPKIPKLLTWALDRELVDTEMDVRIGDLLQQEIIAQLGDSRNITAKLRDKVYDLAGDPAGTFMP
ncbi:MAG: 1-acyl-sn-glycerol-3-phosphate acyltransferase, partial [Akkermansiaceae bacterium]|nr:1-acyl-sn-glycerol-3-phosphate acyltransferase [Akkermansiaceae bacterium]